MAHPDATDGRRPYTTPVLTVYGSVNTMTQTLNMTGVNKDGGANNTKS